MSYQPGMVDLFIHEGDVCSDAPPPVLYKYLAPKLARKVLGERTVRLTQPGAFNDPFEGSPQIERRWSDIEYVRQNLRQVHEDPSFVEAMHKSLASGGALEEAWSRERIEAEPVDALHHALMSVEVATSRNRSTSRVQTDFLLQIVDLSIGVVPFSEDERNVLMWAHYADAHRGVVVGLQTEMDLFREARFGCRRVKYQAERPTLTRDGVWELSFNLTKSPDWCYEKEWRVIDVILGREPVTVHLGFPVHVGEVAPESVSSVTFGSQMSAEDVEALDEILSGSEYAHVEKRRARLDPDEYAVQIDKWD